MAKRNPMSQATATTRVAIDLSALRGTATRVGRGVVIGGSSTNMAVQAAIARSIIGNLQIASRSLLRDRLQLAGVAAVVAVLVGLPLAVDVKTTPELLYRANSADARARPVALAHKPIPLAPSLGLVLEHAFITTLGAATPLDARARRLVLNEARLVADLARLDPRAASPDDLAIENPLLSRLATADYDSVLVRGGQLVIRTGNGTALTLYDVNAEVRTARGAPSTIDGTATINRNRVQLTGRWNADVGTGHDAGTPAGAPPASFRLRSNLIEASFDGQFTTDGALRLLGQTTVKVRKLRLLARMFGIPLAPAADLHNAVVAGDLDWSKGRLSFTRAKIEIDGNTATGALTLQTGGARPAIEGTLGFKVFNAGPYLASTMAVAVEAPRDATNPRTIPLLTAFDADLRVSAEKVVAPHVEAGRAAVTIALRNGQLKAELAELEIEGGHAGGQIMIDAGPESSKLTVRGKLTEVDPGRVFSEHLKRTPLFGRANVAIDATGTGASLPTILANMSGRTTFTLAPGAKLNLDLRTLMNAAQSTAIVGWSAAGKGTTSLDRAEAKLTIANGGLTLDGLSALSGGTSWSGRGKLDLSERLIDLALTPATGTETSATLVIRGPWLDPAISLLRQPMSPASAPIPTPTPTTTIVRN
jgi:AsmA-like C-terminal region